jgi:hypothetical protein
MRFALFAVILIHGLIHLMGFAKAFGYAEMRDLTQAISRPIGLLWLTCALAFSAAGILFIMGRESWWWVGVPAVILSQAVIVTSWRDARFGTLANLIILAPLAAAALDARPASYANQYRAAVREGVARCGEMPLVTEADIGTLPAPVQRYLRYAGAVGKPRVQNFRAVCAGEFRNGLQSRWMRFRSEQYNFFDQPTRAFLMKASMLGVPAEGLHLFRGDRATMQIKMASLFQVVDAHGPKMNQGETVTLFNDLCLMAPACLVDREAIQWEEVGPLTARAKYTRRGITISAELSFDESGRLTNFVSNDRFLSADGKTYANYPWSTPVHEYRDLDGRRVASDAEVVWHMPEGDFSYGKFHLVTIEYNLTDLR